VLIFDHLSNDSSYLLQRHPTASEHVEAAVIVQNNLNRWRRPNGG
jgi:hypothetical protein